MDPAMILGVDALEAEIAAGIALAMELELKVHAAEAQAEAQALARELLEKELPSTLDVELAELDPSKRMARVLEDAFGFEATMKWLDETDTPESRAMKGLWHLLDQCGKAQAVTPGMSATSQRCILTEPSKVPPRHVRQLVVGLVWWAKHPNAVIDSVFPTAVEEMDKDEPWSDDRVSRVLTHLRGALQGAMALALPDLLRSEQWRQRRQRERLGLVLQDPKAKAAFLGFLENDCVTSEIRDLVLRGDDDDNRLGEVVEAFWGSREWMSWLNDRREMRIGEPLPLPEEPPYNVDEIRHKWEAADGARSAAVNEREAALRIIANSTAVHIQRTVRGFLVRRKLRAASDLHRCVRGFLVRRRRRPVEVPVIRIQSAARGWLGRRRVLGKSSNGKERLSAIRIQSAARGWLGRRRVLRRRMEVVPATDIEKVRSHMTEARFQHRRDKRDDVNQRAAALDAKKLPPVIVDAETGAPLKLNDKMWADDRPKALPALVPTTTTTTTTKIQTPTAPPNWAKPHQILMATAGRPAFAPKGMDPYVDFLGMKYRGFDPEIRARRIETPAHDQPFRLLGVAFDRAKLAAAAAVCKSHHTAMRTSLLAELQDDRARRYELHSLRRSPSALKTLDRYHRRARHKGRIHLQRLQYDHQASMVIHLRDAGLLR